MNVEEYITLTGIFVKSCCSLSSVSVSTVWTVSNAAFTIKEIIRKAPNTVSMLFLREMAERTVSVRQQGPSPAWSSANHKIEFFRRIFKFSMLDQDQLPIDHVRLLLHRATDPLSLLGSRDLVALVDLTARFDPLFAKALLDNATVDASTDCTLWR